MRKFKAGDDAVCIDNEFATTKLTVNRIYKIDNIGCSSGRVRVSDDEGKRRFYDPARFITPEQHREKVIEENMKAMADVYLYGLGIVQHSPVPTPKRPKPVSIVLTREAVAKALTKLIREDYGIDAEVIGVQPRPSKELELFLK